MRRIHIIGSGPRSGTTLLMELMKLCFKVNYFPKNETSISVLGPLGSKDQVLLTKNPREISAVRWPLKLRGDLFVVCIIRDPRDSIVSFHGKKPEIYWDGLRTWKHFVKCYPKVSSCANFITIYYEDLVRDPNSVQNHLHSKLPFLVKLRNFKDYHKVSEPSAGALKALRDVRPILDTSVGAWRMHLSRIKEQIYLHGTISDSLITFGYEIDRSWESMLEDVAIKRFEQANPQFMGWWDILRLKKRELKAVTKYFFSKLLNKN